MRRIKVITESSSYIGSLQTRLSTGTEVRLLDVLNNPQRVRSDVSRENPMLVLRETTRFDRAGLWRVDIGGECRLSLGAVVAAWEDPPVRWENPLASYEKRRAGSWRIRVKLQLATEHVIECFILSNTPSLRQLRENGSFIACTEVTLTDLRVGREPIDLPFLGFNVDHVESWSVAEEGRDSRLPSVTDTAAVQGGNGSFVH